MRNSSTTQKLYLQLENDNSSIEKYHIYADWTTDLKSVDGIVYKIDIKHQNRIQYKRGRNNFYIKWIKF